jgi:hypothetical protein
MINIDSKFLNIDYYNVKQLFLSKQTGQCESFHWHLYPSEFLTLRPGNLLICKTKDGTGGGR